MNWPDFETLLAAREDPSAHPQITAHLLEGCAACERRLAILSETQQLLTLGDLPRPKAEWQRAARRLAADPELRLPVRWNARELPQAALPALRGAGLCRRHRVFAAGPTTVDLAMLEPSTLVGTVWRSDASNAAADSDIVCVLDGPGGLRQVALEANGDFRFEGVDPGRYLLLVEGRDWNVVLEDIDLAPSAGSKEALDL